MEQELDILQHYKTISSKLKKLVNSFGTGPFSNHMRIRRIRVRVKRV